MAISKSPLVVLAAGGTGGHMFPAEALAAELKSRDCRLALLTDHRGRQYEGALADIDIYRLSAGGVAGGSVLARIKGAFKLIIGIWQARSVLKKLRPDVVVGFGGYASVPAMMGATMTGLKTVLHEQNAVLGRANRVFAGRVSRIATAFDKVRGIAPADADKVNCVGMPVRPAAVAARDIPYPAEADGGRLEVLVLGGSQGANVFSRVIPAAVGLMKPDARARLHIVQQCRPEDLDKVRDAYDAIGVEAELATFFDDAVDRIAGAHILIARAGASTVAEVTTVGRASILVPYPHAVDDHQTANATAVADAGAAWLMAEPDFTPEALAGRLEGFVDHPDVLKTAAAAARTAGRADATSRLADLVFELLSDVDKDVNRKEAA